MCFVHPLGSLTRATARVARLLDRKYAKFGIFGIFLAMTLTYHAKYRSKYV